MIRHWAWIVCFAVLGIGFAQANDTSTGQYPVRARIAPDFGANLTYEIPPETMITPLALTPDREWLQIEYNEQPAWVPRQGIRLGSDVRLTVATNVPVAPALLTENCISLVGDSVPYGDVVYIIPGYGFAILQTTPLSEILEDALRERGLGYLPVYDRSASAVYLSEDSKNPYRQTDVYQSLMEDRCRLTVIMPWVNDMSLERRDNASTHQQELAQFVGELIQQNPQGQILVLGFYDGAPSEFAAQHAPGFSTDNVVRFNQVLSDACEETGIIGQYQQVTCVPTIDLFAGMNNQHVELEVNQSTLEAQLARPIPTDIQPLFDAYWGQSPDAEVLGDGVHLSQFGKVLLSQTLVEQFLLILPNL